MVNTARWLAMNNTCDRKFAYCTNKRWKGYMVDIVWSISKIRKPVWRVRRGWYRLYSDSDRPHFGSRVRHGRDEVIRERDDATGRGQLKCISNLGHVYRWKHKNRFWLLNWMTRGSVNESSTDKIRQFNRDTDKSVFPCHGLIDESVNCPDPDKPGGSYKNE